MQQEELKEEWIKASERLPKEGAPRSLMNYRLRQWDIEREIPKETVQKYLLDGIEIINSQDRLVNILHTNIEWLDEHPAATPSKEVQTQSVEEYEAQGMAKYAYESKEVQGESLSLEERTWQQAYRDMWNNGEIDEKFNNNLASIYFFQKGYKAATAPLLAQIKQLQSELDKAGKETNY